MRYWSRHVAHSASTGKIIVDTLNRGHFSREADYGLGLRHTILMMITVESGQVVTRLT